MIQKSPPEGKQWPRVYLVDCGLCQNLVPEEQQVAKSVLEGFALWKDEKLAEALWSMGKDGRQRDEVNKAEFHRTVANVFEYYQACKGSDAAIVGRLLEAMFDVVRLHKLQIEPGYSSLLFGALVQENFIMTLDDRFNIIKRVIPWLAGQGIMSQGMFKNYTEWFPKFLSSRDRAAELGPVLAEKGLLSAEGDEHRSFEEQREAGVKEEWKRGILQNKGD